jgi:hypothetical protein
VGYPIENHLWWPGADNKRNRGYQTYYTAGDFEKHYRNRLDQMRIFADRLGLSAGVYTETTDVLGEVNGLLTYDRRVAKLPAEKLAEIHKTLALY